MLDHKYILGMSHKIQFNKARNTVLTRHKYSFDKARDTGLTHMKISKFVIKMILCKKIKFFC